MAAAKSKAGSKSEKIPQTNPLDKSAPASDAGTNKSALKKTESKNASAKKSLDTNAMAAAQVTSGKQKKSVTKTDKKGDGSLGAKRNKAVAQAGDKKHKHKPYELVLSVPRGGQLIHYFTLTPAFPTDAGHGDWLFTEVGSKRDIENLRVEFQRNPLPLERELERAVLIVHMAQDKKAKGKWRFALGGVATDKGDADPNNDVSVEVIDNGFTLVAYVQVLENSRENIPFGFVASFTDDTTGVVSIYASKDPGIQPVRPPKP